MADRLRFMTPTRHTQRLGSRLVVSAALLGLLAACTLVGTPSRPPATSGTPSRAPVSLEPTRVPTDTIEHATGPTDVLLRFDHGPDYVFGELGMFFAPGPEFTLYGDGNVIFRDDRAAPPVSEGLHAQPFRITHLDEGGIQATLAFALFEGGLADARERYGTPEVDAAGYAVYVIDAGGLDKRIRVMGGPDLFDDLADALRRFDRQSTTPVDVWEPERYWGVLFDAGAWIEAGGLMPADVPADGGAAWPWPDIDPEAFAYRNDRYYALDVDPPDPMAPGDRRRVMSSDEAAVLGLADDGGVVEGVYLVGPDGSTLYWFSLWPMLPDDPG